MVFELSIQKLIRRLSKPSTKWIGLKTAGIYRMRYSILEKFRYYIHNGELQWLFNKSKKLCSYHINVLINIWLRTNELKWSAKHKMTSRTLVQACAIPLQSQTIQTTRHVPSGQWVPATIAPRFALLPIALGQWAYRNTPYVIYIIT